MFRSAAVAFALTLVAPVAAQACMLPPPGPGERMTEGRWSTVAVATVASVEAEADERPNRDFHAEFEASRQVEGPPQTGRYRLWHEERSDCPLVLPLPVEGEAWVLYFQGRTEAGGLVHYAWPLTWAERLDPRFGGSPDADIRDLEP